MSILVFGGTTEGRTAASVLEEAGKVFYYSTKGPDQDITLTHGVRLHGAMTKDRILDFCQEKGIRVIVDAAHPFASHLHQTLESVQAEIHLPIVRFDRIYPPIHQDHIVWCNGYADAVARIREDQGIRHVLALTGVQSIAPLRALWQSPILCHFRILDRDSSRLIAKEAGFPQQLICYYHRGEDERILMRQLAPDAILTKESGLSGGFMDKIAAATELGIRIFALRRPETPASFICVNGPHGLRRQIERLLPDFYTLHTGLTTGTYATAAAVAAIWHLLHAHEMQSPQAFDIQLPNGESIPVPIASYPKGNEAIVIKESGDDPDITNHIQIKATVEPTNGNLENNDGYRIDIRGGEGIGIVTLPGLGLEIGEAAINKVPREMIRKNVSALLVHEGISSLDLGVRITISALGGEELARRTFNPRLGIKGGISIVGTSGIIRPFSQEGFIHSIRKSMQVAKATGSRRIVISSGAKSEQYIKAYYPTLPDQAFVHYGNFIGETIRLASEEHVSMLTLGIMIGKAVKLAEGHLDTHSRQVVMNKEFIAQIAQQAGCDAQTIDRIENMTLARDLWNIIPPHQLHAFCNVLARLCYKHCAPLLPEGQLTILIISEDGTIFCG